MPNRFKKFQCPKQAEYATFWARFHTL